MSNPFDLKSWLESTSKIAMAAGDIIMEIYQSHDFQTTYKEDQSPLTKADEYSHHFITDALQKLTPTLPVLSEESQQADYASRRTWTSFWLIDPLDGTKEFIKRNGEFTVNIALIHKCKPVLGVVYAPAMNLIYHAAQGLGAQKFANEKWQSIHVAGYENEKLKIVASRSHAGNRLKLFLDKVGDYDLLASGSSLKICLVAEGCAHIYPRLGPTMEWDTAAGQCIVNEAGGSVLTFSGAELSYNRESLKNPEFIVCGSPSFPWQNYIESFQP